jgi:acyl carrier protein
MEPLNSQIREDLRRMVSDIGEIPSDFDSSSNLYLDLGVPSVKAMQLLMELEDRYGVRVPDEEFVEATSLDSLVAVMERLVASQDSGNSA